MPPFKIFLKRHNWHTQESLYFKGVSEEYCYIILFRTEAVSEERGVMA